MNGTIHYRAAPRIDFTFQFVYLPGDGWRIYIIGQPGYGSRSTSAVSTHRLGLPSHPYVCWDAPLATFKDAQYIAKIWSDSTMVYIRTGNFPGPPSLRVQPPDASVLAACDEHTLRTRLTRGAHPLSGQRIAGATGSADHAMPATPPSPSQSPIRRLLERLR